MLRIFLAAPPDGDRDTAWARYADDGRLLAQGRDVPARWPAGDALEVVLAAAHARLAALDLPPMAPGRLRQAARFALEDQMAASADEAAISITTTGRPVVAAIASRGLVDAIARALPRAARIIPESALAPRNAGWTWCASDSGEGFVRRADGSAFAVGSVGPDLPSELHSALAQAARGASGPAAVHAAFAVDAGQLAAWSQSTGVPFVAARAWRWTGAGTEAFAAAPDFLAGDAPPNAPAALRAAQRFRPALILATLAIALHVTALLAQWAWLNVTDWRLSRQLVEQASAAGLTAATPAAAAAEIAGRNALLRHTASKSAPADALPLLARAAPVIGELPRGALKSARYADNAWTLEIGKLDADALSRVTRALGRAGIDAVGAPSSSGTRMRITLDPAAR
jgi:general secretion pathway protein L